MADHPASETSGSAAAHQMQALIRSVPLRVRVRDSLEGLIVNGLLEPGQHLIEEDLANRLGVSRNPIREGLQQLAHDGFVDLRPGRGAFVHSPTLRDVDDTFHVRVLLESEGARLAARRIDTESLGELERILGLGARAVDEGDPVLLLELNSQFHGIVITSADNAVMERLLTALSKRIRWYFAQVVVERSFDSWHQHEDIYRALQARDGDEAARVMADHVGATRQLLRERLVEAGPEPDESTID